MVTGDRLIIMLCMQCRVLAAEVGRCGMLAAQLKATLVSVSICSRAGQRNGNQCAATGGLPSAGRSNGTGARRLVRTPGEIL